MSVFTCAYDTSEDARETLNGLPEGVELVAYRPLKTGPTAEMVLGFSTWQALVDFTREYVNDGAYNEKDDGASAVEQYLYGYLLKFARCPGSWQ